MKQLVLRRPKGKTGAGSGWTTADGKWFITLVKKEKLWRATPTKGKTLEAPTKRHITAKVAATYAGNLPEWPTSGPKKPKKPKKEGGSKPKPKPKKTATKARKTAQQIVSKPGKPTKIARKDIRVEAKCHHESTHDIFVHGKKFATVGGKKAVKEVIDSLTRSGQYAGGTPEKP